VNLLEICIFHQVWGGNIREFSHEIDEERYKMFVENKLIKNPIISMEIKNDDENSKADYTNFLNSFFPHMIKTYISYKKFVNEPHENIISLTKTHLYTIGVSFCKSTNRKKVETIFDMFSADDQLRNSSKFREFLFMWFALNSRVYLTCLSDFYSPEEIFTDEELKKAHELYSVENIIFLSDNVIKKLFGKAPDLLYAEVMKFFTHNVWLFYGAAIREQLESIYNSKEIKINK